MYLVGIATILSSMVYSLLIFLMYFTKKKIKTSETTIYGIMIIVNLFSLLFELASIFYVKNYTTFGIQSLIVNKSFLICILLWTTALTVYIYRVSFFKTEDTKKSSNRLLSVLATSTFLIFALLIIFLPLKFYSQGSVVYSYGSAADILNVIVGLYVVIWIICLAKNPDSIRSKKYIPLFIFIICVILTMVVRAMNPGILLINATISLVTVLMFHTIENPDIKMLEEVNILKLQAEAADRAKQEFLKQMSHEIATPMNHAIGYNDLIKDTTKESETKEYARYVGDALEQIHRININSVTIAGILSGDFDLEIKSYQIFPLFNKIIDIVNNNFHKDNEKVEFITNIDDNIPKLLDGDSKAVSQILQQVLSNAFKYTKEGTITLDVKSSIKNNKCTLNIKVTDNGIGIKKRRYWFIIYSF